VRHNRVLDTAADIYLDYAGSTPVHARVVDAMGAWFQHGYGNPSAAHGSGRAARAAIDSATETAARVLGCEADELAWTSGGTESNNWALFGALPRRGPGHVVVSAVEHKSVLASAAELELRGFDVSVVPVGSDGALEITQLERTLRPDTRLVSVMFANNETGVLQPVHAIGELCRRRGVIWHCDAVAALGKVALNVRELGCDLLSLSAHKLYAPKGTGLLFARRGLALAPLIHGCGQQCGRRGGTENTPGVVGFGRALEMLEAGEFRVLGESRWRDQLWERLRELVPDAELNGAGARLPNTLSVAFAGASAPDLQAELARRGVHCSAGSAGSGGAASHVLLAMGLGEARARSTLRFTTGLFTSEAQITAAARAVASCLRICRERELAAPTR
jgi:cysteine desulfurase